MLKSLLSWVALFALLLLTACPNTSNGGTNTGGKPVEAIQLGDWKLLMRAGSTNVDTSFINGASIKSQTVNAVPNNAFTLEHLRTINAKLEKLAPELQLSETNLQRNTLQAQSTYGVGLGVFLAISNKDAAPSQDVAVTVSGPKKTEKPLTYKAGNRWAYQPIVSAQGVGAYTVTANTPAGNLTSSTTLDVNTLLPTVLEAGSIKSGQTGSVLLSRWTAVVGAGSYVGIVYDKTDQKAVAGGIFAKPEFRLDTFEPISGHSYQLDVIATNLDLTRKNTDPYTPVPDTARSSYSSFNLPGIFPSVLQVDMSKLVLFAKPGASAEGTVTIKSTSGGVVVASSQLEGPNFSAVGEANFALLYDESTQIQVRGTCPASSGNFTGMVTITSNATENPVRKVPVTLECSNGVEAKLEAGKRSHRNSIISLSVSADGKYVASSDGSSILIHNASTGKLERAIDNPDGGSGIAAVAWNPTGSKLAAFVPGALKLIDPSTGQQTNLAAPASIAPNGNSNVTWLAWSPDGTQLAISGVGNGINIYNSSTGALNKRLEISANNGLSHDLDWKANRLMVYDYTPTGYVNIVLNSSNWQEEDRFVSATPAVLNPTGSKAAMQLGEDNQYNIGIRNLASKTFEPNLELASASSGTCKDRTLRWSRDGQKLACIVNYNNVRIYSFGSQAYSGFMLNVYSTGSLTQLEWNADSGRVLIGRDTYAQLFETNGTPMVRYGYHSKAIKSLAWSPDGTQLLSKSDAEDGNNSELFLLNPALMPNKILEIGSEIDDLAWLNNTSILGLNNRNGLIRTFGIPDGNTTQTFEGYAPIALSQDASKLAVYLNGNQIRTLNATTGAILNTFTRTEGCCPPIAIRWSPDGMKIAILDTGNSGLAVYTQDGTRLWQSQLDSYGNNRLFWTGDGTRIIVSSSYSGSSIRNASDGSQIDQFTGNAGSTYFEILASSLNGAYWIARTITKTILVNATSGRVLLELPEPAGSNTQTALSAAWTPQGDRVAISTGNGVYVYKISSK
jgi:WD40 repeat protein